MFRKLASLFVFSLTIPFGVAQTSSILVGSHGLTFPGLQARLGTSGEVTEITNGYFRVVPRNGFSVADLEKKLRGSVDVILRGTADQVDTNSLASVSDHVRYINGAFHIRHGRQPKRGEMTGAERLEAVEYFLSTRADRHTGRLNGDAYRKAVLHRAQMESATPAMIDPTRSALAPVAWAYVGPKNLATPYQQFFGQQTLSGRKNSIAYSSESGTYYVGSANGGVWKTTDGGTSFQPKSDAWPMMSVTALAVDPTDANIVYAGTGDAYGTGQQSFGIMKSETGGDTWKNYGQADFGDSVVTRIALVPGAPEIVLALTSGPSGDIWRSTNGGLNWSRTDAPDGNWQDIDVRTNGTFIAVGSHAGIYRSVSNGASWVLVNTPGSPGATLWDVACSKTVANRFYLMTSDKHIYRTANAGSTWTDITPFLDAAVANPSLNWASASSGMFIETAPGTTPAMFDVIFCGLQTLSISDDGGVFWTDVTESLETSAKVHAGMMCFASDPSDPTRGLLGGEGGLTGIVYTDPSNTAVFSDLNATFFDMQFNSVAVHPTNTTQVMGGAVGNATPASRADLANWKNLYDGDGAFPAFDLSNPGLHYTGSANGGVYRYTFASDVVPDDISPGGGLFVSPLITSGAAGSVPTFGAADGNVRTFESGVWNTHATGGGPVRRLARSFFDSRRIYTGATNGDMYRTNSIASGFTKIDSSLPNRPIGGIAESPYVADQLLVGLHGVGFPNMVYRTPNASVGSPTWTNVSGSGQFALPQVPVNDVEFDPFTNVYYAATDIGIFVSPDAGVRWFNMNTMGLPNIAVTDLWLYSNGSSNFLYAATYGRGIWRCLLGQRFLTQIQIFKPAIYGGQQNTVTLKLNGAAPAGAVASMTDDSANVSVTPLVFFPIGSTQVTFTIFTTNPTADQTVTLTGRVFGTTTTGSFTLHHIPAFTYTPSSPDYYGGDRISAVIDFGIPAPITAVFTFSDNATEVSSPTSTSIAAGSQTKQVTLFTLPVTSSLTADISARLANTTASSSVTLHPRPTLTSLMLQPNTVVGGNPVEAVLTLSFPGAGGDIEVLTSDTSTLVGTPSSVTIPQGTVQQPFDLTTSPVSVNANVTVKAIYRGTTRTAVLTLTP